MSLIPGTRVGPFEILRPLGAGGMGEVFLARDSRLDREVAIKTLPGSVAGDPGRLARFEREAKLLASLNHPNVGAIYGLEDAGGTPCLILEFVAGETLSQRLARGALPLRDALEVCGQIASAIEAAHERGIVHRDLKPANVMLTPSGTAKVLDFGLSKSAVEDSQSPELTAMPTLANSATGVGVILGTAPYMSPEQARGQAVDRRTDVWAFGCIVYECLCGRPAFSGPTTSDVIAKILEREPEWAALPVAAPERVRELVRKCLTRDLAERPRDIGDLRREISKTLHELSSSSSIVPGLSQKPSLAVLYFENLAEDKESEYFCAGVTEDILTDLSKIKGLRVASRNAVARYRGQANDIPKVAAELGVSAVLEGSVRRSGDKVRITAQLINAADGFHLWAERYDRTLQDVFAVQEEIATSIASALSVALTPAETVNLVQDRPADARAYDLYLRGRQAYGEYTKESHAEALRLFREAVKVDPEYALAYAGIADCYGQELQNTGSPNARELRGLGLEAADRAISLSPSLPDGYKAKALVLKFSGDEAGSAVNLRKALEVNPRHTPSMINLGVATFTTGNLVETERLARRVLEIDPQEGFAMLWLFILMDIEGRTSETRVYMERVRVLSHNPLYKTVYYLVRIGLALEAGDFAQAEEIVRLAHAEGAYVNNIRSYEALLAMKQGKLDEARRIVEELAQTASIGFRAVVNLAETAVGLGKLDLASNFVTRPLVVAYKDILVRVYPALHPLLDLPDFGPRRSDKVLVWPIEAPMLDAARFKLFKEVRLESALDAPNSLMPESTRLN